MTDKQTREIVYAILGGAFIIALAIRPSQISFGTIFQALLVGALVFGLVKLVLYLLGHEWLLPITVAAVVVAGIYFVHPIAAWVAGG
jgi:hypothetical protein